MKRIIVLAFILSTAVSCSLNESYDGFVGRETAVDKINASTIILFIRRPIRI